MNSKSRVPVSVVVPSFNNGRLLAEALDSILKQTVALDQIIVVDDGSSDDTEQVVRRYKGARIEYHKQEHAGVATARNTGLNAARSEFVTFLNADDRWGPEFVERLHDFLAEDPTAACAFSSFVWFQNATGKIVRDQFPSYPELRRPVLLNGVATAFARIPQERAFGVLVGCNEIPAHLQVMMFRRASIESLRFDPALTNGHEILFALRTFLQGAVIFTDEVLAEVRLHENSAAEPAIHKLSALTAITPHVTRTVDLTAHRERLVKAHIDAALYQTKAGRVRAGLRSYRDSLHVPGSRLRKINGLMRVVLALPKGLGR